MPPTMIVFDALLVRAGLTLLVVEVIGIAA
jgi:hypothetical protein